MWYAHRNDIGAWIIEVKKYRGSVRSLGFLDDLGDLFFVVVVLCRESEIGKEELLCGIIPIGMNAGGLELFFDEAGEVVVEIFGFETNAVDGKGDIFHGGSFCSM